MTSTTLDLQLSHLKDSLDEARVQIDGIRRLLPWLIVGIIISAIDLLFIVVLILLVGLR